MTEPLDGAHADPLADPLDATAPSVTPVVLTASEWEIAYDDAGSASDLLVATTDGTAVIVPLSDDLLDAIDAVLNERGIGAADEYDEGYEEDEYEDSGPRLDRKGRPTGFAARSGWGAWSRIWDDTWEGVSPKNRRIIIGLVLVVIIAMIVFL